MPSNLLLARIRGVGVPGVGRKHGHAVHVVRADRVGHGAHVGEGVHVCARRLQRPGLLDELIRQTCLPVAVVRQPPEVHVGLHGPRLALEHLEALGRVGGRAVDAVHLAPRRRRREPRGDRMAVLAGRLERGHAQVRQHLRVRARKLLRKHRREHGLGHFRLEWRGRVVCRRRERVAAHVEARVALGNDALVQVGLRREHGVLGHLPRAVVDGFEHGLHLGEACGLRGRREEQRRHLRLRAVGGHADQLRRAHS